MNLRKLSGLALFCLSIGLIGSAVAQERRQQGTTALRLDAVDISAASTGTFVFYASFMDRYFKPVPATNAKDWTLTFNGEPTTGELTVQTLEKSDRGIELVVVIAAYDDLAEEIWETNRKGVTTLLNRLRPDRDKSALVVYGKSVEATSALTASHADAVSWLSERKAEGNTVQLLESVDKAVDFFPTEFDTIGRNRAILVVSDGFDDLDEQPKERRERMKALLRKAKDRGVRISTIAITAIESEGAATLKKLAYSSGGTYREAPVPSKIGTFLDHFAREILQQHVVVLKTSDFEGDRDTAFKLKVAYAGGAYSSNDVILRIPAKESHLWSWVMAIGGGLLGFIVLIFGGRWLGRMMRRDRSEAAVETGPELVHCAGCNNQIPEVWLVCKYCEALPHLGKLIVRSSGVLNGKTFFIRESLTNIGSATSNGVVLQDRSVSKRHAGIKVQDNRFELADFGSTNGVLVNGQRITKQFLRAGDLISIGAVELDFKLKS